MPTKPARSCRIQLCPNLTYDSNGYCPNHKSQIKHYQDLQRPTSTQRGYDYRWHQARTSYLYEHPLCVVCLAESKVTAAALVDHIIPHKGNYLLMWDESNWQSLCIYHHNIKTATQDGAFGNKEIRG